jgi:hypothetical protein
MSRLYKPMPPLWRIEELVRLSSNSPSALEWSTTRYGHREGEPAGRLNRRTGFYTISIDNESYLAHRIVFYLRTGCLPDNHAVEHLYVNKEKDNRQELRATYKARKPKTKTTTEDLLDL